MRMMHDEDDACPCVLTDRQTYSSFISIDCTVRVFVCLSVPLKPMF